MATCLTITELVTKIKNVYSFWSMYIPSPGDSGSNLPKYDIGSIKHDYDDIFTTLRSGRYRFTDILTDDGNTLVHLALTDSHFSRLSQFILKNAERLDVPNDTGWLPHQIASKLDAIFQLKFMIEERGIDPFQTTWLQHAHSLAIAGNYKSPQCFEYLADKYCVKYRILELWRPKETVTPFAKMFLKKFSLMDLA